MLSQWLEGGARIELGGPSRSNYRPSPAETKPVRNRIASKDIDGSWTNRWDKRADCRTPGFETRDSFAPDASEAARNTSGGRSFQPKTGTAAENTDRGAALLSPIFWERGRDKTDGHGCPKHRGTAGPRRSATIGLIHRTAETSTEPADIDRDGAGSNLKCIVSLSETGPRCFSNVFMTRLLGANSARGEGLSCDAAAHAFLRNSGPRYDCSIRTRRPVRAADDIVDSGERHGRWCDAEHLAQDSASGGGLVRLVERMRVWLRRRSLL